MTTNILHDHQAAERGFLTMHTPRLLRWVVGIAALSMLAAACGSGSGDKAASGGEFSYPIVEPEALGITSDCYATDCIAAISVLYTGLLRIDPETGKPNYQMAKSITTTDNKVWTIKLKKGRTFHNGEPVNADAFIRAWNYGAYAPHRVRSNFLYSKIKGYDAMNSDHPTAKKLSGLKKIDEYTFQVTLSEPFSQWLYVMSSLSTFAPMAKECLNDVKSCKVKPIGNGPYKIDGSWQHDEYIKVTRYDKYQGKNAGHAKEITFKIYNDPTTSFNDWLAGTLDFAAPPNSKVQEAKANAGDRMVQKRTSHIDSLHFPTKLDTYSDPRVRRAISMAINRKAITEKVAPLLRPADDVISPVVPGYKKGACEYCHYDPKRAKKLLKQAGGFKGKKMSLWYESGGSETAWMQAIGNQVKSTLGIPFTLHKLQPSRYWGQDQFNGPSHSSWSMDYPSPENYLRPLFSSQGLGDTAEWTSPKFEHLLDKGDVAPSTAKGVEYYRQAADVVDEELPSAPLFFGSQMYVYTPDVTNVQFLPNSSNIDLAAVKVTG
ncbi:MAG: peptide ABC transporter substrate-binding protein [Streptosporangiales bacterium]